MCKRLIRLISAFLKFINSDCFQSANYRHGFNKRYMHERYYNILYKLYRAVNDDPMNEPGIRVPPTVYFYNPLNN